VTFDLDAELVPFAALLPSLDLSDVGKMRGILRQMAAQKKEFISDVALTVEDKLVPNTEDSVDVTVRSYRPTDVDSFLPGILYMHGGGYVSGDLNMSDAWCRRLAADVGALVVSVDYRLAPENVFPAALNDCYAVLEWMATNGNELGLDVTRIAVAGDSAGANLATATAIRARDNNGPQLCFQSLSIPGLDDRQTSVSVKSGTHTPLWTANMSAQSWAYYLGASYTPGSEDVPPLAAPARVEDLSNLPPAFVVACDFDPLRDEALEYGMRLAQANVRTEMHLYPGTFHSSRMFEGTQVSQRMINDCVGALQRAFS